MAFARAGKKVKMHRSNRGWILSLSLFFSSVDRKEIRHGSFPCFVVGKSVHREYIVVRSVEVSANGDLSGGTIEGQCISGRCATSVRASTQRKRERERHTFAGYDVYAIRCRPSHRGERTLALGAIHVAATAWRRISYCVCRAQQWYFTTTTLVITFDGISRIF